MTGVQTCALPIWIRRPCLGTWIYCELLPDVRDAWPLCEDPYWELLVSCLPFMFGEGALQEGSEFSDRLPSPSCLEQGLTGRRLLSGDDRAVFLSAEGVGEVCGGLVVSY